MLQHHINRPYRLLCLLGIGLLCSTLAEAAPPPRYAAPPGFFDDLKHLDIKALPTYDELSINIRSELPRPKISLHYYAKESDDRFAIVNDFKAYEGLPIGRELWIYQIVKEGVVLKYEEGYFIVPK